jgi:hypothetical protein
MKEEEKSSAPEYEGAEQRLICSRREGKSLWEFGLSELVRLRKLLRLLAPIPWLWISTLAKKEEQQWR